MATTGDVRVASGAQISAKNIAARSSSITFLGSGTDPGTGLVIDAGLQAALLRIRGDGHLRPFLVTAAWAAAGLALAYRFA